MLTMLADQKHIMFAVISKHNKNPFSHAFTVNLSCQKSAPTRFIWVKGREGSPLPRQSADKNGAPVQAQLAQVMVKFPS